MGFAGGEKSLAKMVITAQKLNMNVDEIFDVAKKARTIEGAMEMASELQLAGGSFANINPMDLFAAASVVRWRREAYQSLSQVTHDEIKQALLELNLIIEKENVVTDPDTESLEQSLPNFKRTAPNDQDYLITLGQFVVRRPKDQKSRIKAILKK
jgi:hypothetical protein